ncbi:MAG: arsenate reductase ArsC [Dehalococcoidia bacterium]|nr:MAG: arsenate reductase ArsC [Dehalococcoidia bacterium]
MKRVLFVCIGNGGRSQMAEAFFNHFSAGRRVAMSAGTQPATSVSRTAIAAMAELGIDISAQKPKPLTQRLIQQAERIITMGCDVAESCPAGFHPSEDWGLEDTQGQPLEKVRLIRDQIRERVLALLADLGEPHSAETM